MENLDANIYLPYSLAGVSWPVLSGVIANADPKDQQLQRVTHAPSLTIRLALTVSDRPEYLVVLRKNR